MLAANCKGHVMYHQCNKIRQSFPMADGPWIYKKKARTWRNKTRSFDTGEIKLKLNQDPEEFSTDVAINGIVKD